MTLVIHFVVICCFKKKVTEHKYLINIHIKDYVYSEFGKFNILSQKLFLKHKVTML